MPEGCEGPEGPQGAEVWGVPRGAWVQGVWGCCRGAEGPGAPFAGPQLAAVLVRGVPWGAPCLGPAWPVGLTPPRPGVPSLLRQSRQGCGKMPRTEGFHWCLAVCSNPQAVFCAQNFLHFALFISALAKTLHLTLWGEPVARVWSLRAAATLKPLPNVAPRRGYTNPWAVGCEVAVSPGLRQERGIVTQL